MNDLDIYTEIASSIISAELEKISGVTSQDIPISVKKVCKELEQYLIGRAGDVNDNCDLIELREKISVISEFIKLIMYASPNRSSWWAAPLIRECYKLCNIEEKREILIIHSQDVGVEDFSVAPSVLEILSSVGLLSEPTDVPLDVFIIPVEAKYDISFVSLIGHEIGHVYWRIHEKQLIDKINESFGRTFYENDLFGDKIPIGDLFHQYEAQLARQKEANFIEEYLSDKIGRYLLGPAFDFSLLKLFCSLPINNNSETHPPQANRIRLSYNSLTTHVESLRKFSQSDQLGGASTEQVVALAEYISRMCAAVKKLMGGKDSAIIDKVTEFSEELANTIVVNEKLQNRFSEMNLFRMWKITSSEFDAFRPPFESVSTNKPEVITPTEALVGATIYYFGGAYADKNEYWLGNNKVEEEKKEVIKLKIIEHLQYSVGLHDFVAHANSYFDDFKESEWKNNTLWDLRGRKTEGKPSALVVTPTINPKTQYGQNSVDLRLGSSFLVNIPSKYKYIEPAPKDDAPDLSMYYNEMFVPVGSEFVLHPHQFVLASVLEYLCLPNCYYALVLGRSTWGRLGLNIATATTVQAGFRGCLTLELRNLGESPLPLSVGTRIAQLCLIRVPTESTGESYFKGKGKYIGPVKAEIPRIHEDPDWHLLNSFLR